MSDLAHLNDYIPRAESRRTFAEFENGAGLDPLAKNLLSGNSTAGFEMLTGVLVALLVVGYVGLYFDQQDRLLVKPGIPAAFAEAPMADTMGISRLKPLGSQNAMLAHSGARTRRLPPHGMQVNRTGMRRHFRRVGGDTFDEVRF